MSDIAGQGRTTQPLRRNEDFRLKTTLSSDRFGPNEHLERSSSPNLNFGYVPQVPGIYMNHSNQKAQPLW